jgi:hypothetical protein
MECCPIQLQLLIVCFATCLSDSGAFSDTGIAAYPAVFPAVLDDRAAKRPVRTLLQKID